MSKTKRFIQDVEEVLTDCLTEKGMTNDQACGKIRQQFGELGVQYALQLTEQWKDHWEGDNDAHEKH